jgi:signal transduction histidine kinase
MARRYTQRMPCRSGLILSHEAQAHAQEYGAPMELREGGTRGLSLAGDVALAVALFIAALSSIADVGNRPGLVLLAAVGTLSLAARRFYPLPVLAITVVLTVYVYFAYDGWWPFGLLIALYSAAAHLPRRASIVAGAVSLLAVAVPTVVHVDWSPFGWDDLALVAGRLVPVAAAWILGDNIRTRREHLRTLRERAEQLEREQEANARRAAVEEQARIARELHDVIAHNLSVIVLQATGADAVFERDPADARRAVRTIGVTARQALDELRRVLDVLRADGTQASRAPQPDLGSLERLIGSVRAAGLPVDLEIDGEHRALPAAVELSAYRIVQEALTNTLRHADATKATVVVRYAPEVLELEISDDGKAKANGSGGHGLAGMRERAAMFGGEVVAGPADGGGYRVEARLPVPGAAA